MAIANRCRLGTDGAKVLHEESVSGTIGVVPFGIEAPKARHKRDLEEKQDEGPDDGAQYVTTGTEHATHGC